MAVRKLLALMLLLLVSSGPIDIVKGDPDTASVYWRCNADLYTSSDPFAYSLDYVLDDMVTVTPNHPGYNYYTSSPYPTSRAYGHATCNQGLSFADCVTCVMSARDRVLDACRMSVGALMVLGDCNMRYEKYPFIDN